MPRVKPKTISQEIDDAFEREVDAEATLIRSAGTLQSAKERRRIALRDVNPYGATSPHSWVLDRAAVTLPTGNAAARERLDRFDASREARAITTTTVPDLIAMAPRRYAGLQSLTAALGLPMENTLPASLRGNVVVSPAAPLTLGGGTEDWILLLNRAAVPLVRNAEPNVEFQRQGPSAGNTLLFRWLIYAYVALGVSRRPEGVGIVKGTTAPAF